MRGRESHSPKSMIGCPVDLPLQPATWPPMRLSCNSVNPDSGGHSQASVISYGDWLILCMRLPRVLGRVEK